MPLIPILFSFSKKFARFLKIRTFINWNQYKDLHIYTVAQALKR